MDYTAHYDSPLGGITIASDGESLIGLWFDGQKHFGSTLTNVVDDASELRIKPENRAALPVFDLAIRWLDDYFDGKNIVSLMATNTPLYQSLSLRGSHFRCRVWRCLCEIPYGTTVTYGQIARRLGCGSAQAIGSAVAHNPISLIIPCHRVIASDGNLTGYAAGIDRKQWLLQHERGSL